MVVLAGLAEPAPASRDALAPALRFAQATDSARTIDVPGSDVEMIEAQVRARASLDRFWAVQASPRSGEEGFALKVAIPVQGGETEHIWVNNITREGEKVFGSVSNAPQRARSIRLGERIEVLPDQISDWMYLRNGRIVGNFTLRPLLKRMPPQEAERYRAMLAEP